MTRSGITFPLQPWVLLTDVIGSGFLPTPSAVSYGTNQGGASGRVGTVRPSLEAMARHSLWPTPRANKVTNVTPAKALTRLGKHNLEDWAAVSEMENPQAGGQLNPTWVEWLMNWPLGWTDLDKLSTEIFDDWHRKTKGAEDSAAKSYFRGLSEMRGTRNGSTSLGLSESFRYPAPLSGVPFDSGESSTKDQRARRGAKEMENAHERANMPKLWQDIRLQASERDNMYPFMWEPFSLGETWFAEEPPDIPRVANGVANRVDRLRAIGNGQVPAVVRLAWTTLYGRMLTL